MRIKELKEMFDSPDFPKAFLFKRPEKSNQLYKQPSKPFYNPKWPDGMIVPTRCWKALHCSPLILNIKDFA